MQPRTVALLVGVPIGLYVVPASYQVYGARKEESRVEGQVKAERAAAAKAVAAQEREEAAIRGFEQAVAARRADVETVDAELAVVQQRLGELQEMRALRLKEAAEAQDALEQSKAKLMAMVQDARRHEQAATAAQAALAEAHARALAAKRGLNNPLEHPLPSGPEEKHPQKPTWRRGYSVAAWSKTDYLLCTLTPSDCSTRRLRPPREWLDSLLGGFFASFVVGAASPDGGQPVSFLLKCHAYEYVKAEYYLQGGETKRMFKVMGLQPGDGLKLEVAGRQSGIPTTRLTIIPAARNPNAAAVLAAAAEQAAKREARLAANPKPPKGAARKRKPGEEGDTDEDEVGEGLWASGRQSRQRSRKHFGDEFISGLDEAWAAAGGDESDYEEEGAGKRQRGGSRSGASSGHPSGGAWQPPGGQAGGPALAGAQPEVVATEGTKMRIKINRGPGGKGGGDDATPRSGVGQGMGSSDAGGEGKGEHSKPRQQAAASGTAGQRAVPRAGRSPEPVALLSKKLLRDESGAVTGAECRLGWEAGSRSTLSITRKLSQFGLEQHDVAAIDNFDCKPAECVLDLTLRLQGGGAGRGDLLEQAILQLCEAL
ncbi:MLO 11 [Chlorella sorokiniana]|uniref:MLO 11 n=1 Tax=Chlorella sorokiniana TaxID=3076 RepID=A0A2P6U4B6_CHLSO|nr:MLO 11 [Chlorella sorokiniana]|eukprot:PRW61154.1 MLO 11 [Chlorella sorokiniana]